MATIDKALPIEDAPGFWRGPENLGEMPDPGLVPEVLPEGVGVHDMIYNRLGCERRPPAASCDPPAELHILAVLRPHPAGRIPILVKPPDRIEHPLPHRQVARFP